MFDLDSWREIFITISKNKLRTVLSGFTIAFAILLFTILFGIGNGLRNTFKEQFAGDSMLSIFLRPFSTSKPYKGYQIGRKIEFTNDDYDFILDKYDDQINGISPRIVKYLTAAYKGTQNNYEVLAVYPSYLELESLMMQSGRFLNVLDVKNDSKVIAIGRLVERDLFDGKSAIGKNVNLGGISYKVIGVFSDEGGDNEERRIYTPFKGFQKLYGYGDKIEHFALTYNPKMTPEQGVNFGYSLRDALKEQHDIAPQDNKAIYLRNYAEGASNVNSFMTVLKFIIFFIGMGTLVAGIVGISNIMVFIVKERTKELGIRKALGATPKSIISVILMESMFITTLSGYVGLLIGTSVLKLIGNNFEKYFITNPSVDSSLVVGATIMLIIAGSIAGYLPAKRAAEIKPIVALRDE